VIGEDKMKTTKIIVALIMTFTLLTGMAFAASPLQDGEYTINVQAVNATTGEPSMANNAITNPVKLQVKDGKIHVILEMADSMYDLAVENGNGGFTLAEELSENTVAKTFTYKFSVKSIDEPVLMETVVAAMGRKVNFKLAFSNASPSVDATSKATTKPSTTNTTNTNTTNTTTTASANTNVPNPKTGDNTVINLFNVILLAVGASIVTYGVHKTKKATNN